MLLVKVVDFTKRINVKLNQNVVSNRFAEVEPGGVVFGFVFDV